MAQRCAELVLLIVLGVPLRAPRLCVELPPPNLSQGRLPIHHGRRPARVEASFPAVDGFDDGAAGLRAGGGQN